jgi:hypothetical protein
MSTTVAPHTFTPLRFWDARPGGRCRRCYLPCSAHPIHAWVPARPVGDKEKAALTFENLHGRTG